MKKSKIIAASIVSAVFLFCALGSSSSRGSSSSSTNATTAESTTKATTETTQSGPRTVGIGEEFGNDTIKGVVLYADLDYTDYNDIWTEVPEGKKAVFIQIKVANLSDKSNYVSVGDFSCYVDNVIVNAELVSGSDDNYNANIEAGRTAVLGALYVVPEDAVNIELEYTPIGERSTRQIIIIADENTEDTVIEAPEGAGDLGVSVSGKVKTISVGEEFGNKTITGVVEDVDFDYTDYNEAWTEIPEGKKAIYITINVKNISDDTNYVSVGDFACYVDNVTVNAEMVTGSDDNYNANIEPGREAILGAMYVIPEDAESIELEYTPIGESAERVIIKIL